MSDKTYNELKEEAIKLGVQFKGNPKKDELEKMIKDFLIEEAGDAIAVKIDDVDEDIEDTEEETGLSRARTIRNDKAGKLVSKADRLKQMIADAKKEAFKKRVVILTSNDKRDNDYVTSVPLFFENQYFALDRIVPLGIAVELEQCLIDIAKSTTITLHKDEIVDGKRTGNKIPVQAKKFNISYEEIK